MNEMERKQIAEQTLMQLGGQSRIRAMVGASYFMYGKYGSLSFSFKGSQYASRVSIFLNSSDLYDLTFYAWSNNSLHMVKVIRNVFAEDLIPMFEQYTGLYLSL